MTNWIVDSSTQNNTIFSRAFYNTAAEENCGWVEIYDWCNAEFNANNWHFWYDIPVKKCHNDYVIGNFEFLNESDAVLFQLRWV